ncbi:MAG: hypothetical protein M0Z41_00030, partial [Peptococcaceae bacterium]|nr:hypothetical protein [Peptococcaceae bacterium]
MTPVAAPAKDNVLMLFPELIRRVDPDVRDVILIGSAVYAPDLARDYDLVVTTRSDRDTSSLFDQLSDALSHIADKPVDIILRQPGEEIRSLALGILAGCVLSGDGDTVEEAKTSFEKGCGVMASFVEAEAHLRAAVRNLDEAERLTDPSDKDVTYKSAFDHLFHAARHSALVYLQRSDTRWSGIG